MADPEPLSAEMEATYDQPRWAPNMKDVLARFEIVSGAARAALGAPDRLSYGEGADERLDLYRAAAPHAPVLIFVHGGGWRGGCARDNAFPAEMLVGAGIHYVALDFSAVTDVGGDLAAVADQVRRAVAWIHRNAAALGADPGRLFLAGHSSGAHLAAVALTTDWDALGLPRDVIRGGFCVSGIYDLAPVRLTSRRDYIRFDDRMEALLSPLRHVDRLAAPLLLAVGSRESPEFQRQARDFAAAAQAAGRTVELIVADACNHFEIAETLGNPYGVLGRALLRRIAAA